LWRSILLGLAGKCPHCGHGELFRGYLKVAPVCPSCGEEMHHHRADDAPPYFTILVVGHIVVGSILALEEADDAAPLWLQAIIWPALTIGLSLVFLPRFKGALIGLQWANRMHGFGVGILGRRS
jgi:uncharacterized protein (DUF983 family)